MAATLYPPQPGQMAITVYDKDAPVTFNIPVDGYPLVAEYQQCEWVLVYIVSQHLCSSDNAKLIHQAMQQQPPDMSVFNRLENDPSAGLGEYRQARSDLARWLQAQWNDQEIIGNIPVMQLPDFPQVVPSLYQLWQKTPCA